MLILKKTKKSLLFNILHFCSCLPNHGAHTGKSYSFLWFPVDSWPVACLAWRFCYWRQRARTRKPKPPFLFKPSSWHARWAEKYELTLAPSCPLTGGRTLEWTGTTPVHPEGRSPITCVCLGAISDTVRPANRWLAASRAALQEPAGLINIDAMSASLGITSAYGNL